jgi:hypothetical protein
MFEIQYDESLTADEKAAIEKHRDMFLAAYAQGLYWTAFVDGRNHRYLDVRRLSDRRAGIGRFKLGDLDQSSLELRTDIASGRHPFVDQ